MSNMKQRNGLVLLLFILIGIVLGGLLVDLTASIPSLSWLGYGNTFGIDTPMTLNLGVLVVSFAFQIKITIASIIGVIIAVAIFKVI